MTERPRRTALKNALSWLVLALCLGWIVAFFARNPAELEVLRSIRGSYLAALLAFNGVYFALHSLRYQVILEQASRRRIGFWPWLRLFVLGRFLNTMVPQAGNVYRGVRLKRDHGIAYSDYLGAFLAFAWLGMALNLAVAAVTIWLSRPGMRLAGLPAAALIGATAAAVVLGPVIAQAVFRRWRLRTPVASWLRDRLDRVLEVAVRELADGGYAARVLALGLAGVALACVTLAVGFGALGLSPDLAELLVFYALLQISSYLVITPGNLGLRELAFGLVGPELGVGTGESILLSTLLRAVHFVAMVGLALPLGGARLLGDPSLRR